MRMQIVASALVLGASPVAADSGDRLSREVEYVDLDVGSRSGRAALHRRVSNAIGELCADAVGRDDGSSEHKFATMKCRKQAWRQARPQIASFIDRSVRNPTALAAAVRISAPAR